MNVNLYYPCRQDNDNDVVTFTLLHAINSVIVFVFGVDSVTDVAQQTRLVSGYEKNAYRRINMNITTVHADDGYVISCVRMPYICMKLLTSCAFTAPPTIVIVKCNQAIEVWHVFGVRKRAERTNFNKIVGVYVNERGHEILYNKEMLVLTGNVPAAFVSTLSKHINNVQDVDVGAFFYPDIQTNEYDIRFNYNKSTSKKNM
ncbi:early 23 kDa protein [Orgyia leucostigma nucleopolyhedrovirus]|uniref:Early 23 kDa protein n=1 Tax=Orgyia leucostigma nucleopolyhedrovirus TaxID=490711 RepID=B0FDM6_9ABAC|nr:early 23 kDa protein [Orgyia leucostigma nucleopolyhedrovirus]ABY65734.1 early 23 kDa protein [Orgyia leucostigma nucleopolyhedrovirus]